MELLVIAPFFPPDEGVAILRIMSLTKYLKRQGHHVTVMTAQKNKSIPNEYCDADIQVGADQESLKQVGNYKAFCIYREAYLEAFRKACDESHITMDAVLITGGPFYTFAVASEARKRDIPCVLDFRDPWAWDIREKKEKYDPRCIVKRIVFKHMEKKVIRDASAVVTVTPGWVNIYKKHYSDKKDQIYLVENGYDDERLQHITIEKKKKTDFSKFTIGVFGKLFYYSEFYSKIFLKAIREMLDEDSFFIGLEQIGKREENADTLLNNAGLTSNLLHSTGMMDYEDGIVELAKSDIFLIIDSRLQALGTKLYDYIYLGKPVILVY